MALADIPNPKSSIDELAQIAFDAYYSTDLDEFRTYHATLNDDNPNPPAFDADALADLLNDDIRDLLHNANDAEIFPFSDELDESDAIALSTRFHDDFDSLDQLCDAIAKLMLASNPNI